jgi:hypothetical protein
MLQGALQQLRAYADELGLHPVCTIKEKAFRATLPKLVSSGGLVVERWLQHLLSRQGFTFNDELDNKSVTSPEALFDALARYWSKSSFNPNRQCLNTAIGMAFKVFGHQGGAKLNPLPLDEDLQSAIHLQKSSGAPEFTSKGDAFSKDLQRARSILEGKVRFPYCMPFRRCQHGKKGPKTRLVWGYPLSMTLLEARFARPLIDAFLGNNPVMAFGYTNAGVGSRLVNIENGGIRLSLDFSGFDASVKKELIEAAFRILSTHFPALDKENERCWSVVLRYFINTPIAMPDGCLYVKRSGVPSGSYFTQLVDSIVNFIAVQYAFLQAHEITIHPEKILVLGDDCVLSTPVFPEMNALVQAFSELGLRLNRDKTQISKEGQPVSFLGHSWRRGLKYRPVGELLVRAIYPEIHSSQSGVEAVDRVFSICGSAEGGVKLLRLIQEARFGKMAPGPKSLVHETFNPVIATGHDEWRSTIEPELYRETGGRGVSGPAVIILGPLR